MQVQGGGSITCLMCLSPKGSISSMLLTEALKYLDQLNVFERRQDVPTPFGLLEGHGSRLQLPFLEYINSITPDVIINWIQTLGNPNATDVWQVGDRINHNVCWKMAMTIEKYSLIRFKQRHEFESTDFDRCDIVPLINQSWNKSFSIRDKKCESIIYRVWFHLDRSLLKYPVILKKKIRLDDEQLHNQHDSPLRTNPHIPARISTDNLTIII